MVPEDLARIREMTSDERDELYRQLMEEEQRYLEAQGDQSEAA